ncbi:MAG: hypothetical protein Q8R55_01370 [Candidatus Taylorbacteria bacterium]|nr:hypothetical protein [Candidatus Taylorbacteria bacterium]
MIIKKFRSTKPSQKYLIVFLLAVLVFAPTPAGAQVAGDSNPGIISCALNPIDCTLNFVRSLLINLIAFVGSGINYALHMETANEVVTSSWEIVRGFSNMFFILALIIMAFATIFSIGDLQKYNFSSLIVRFLIAVLLINFSLVIGELIIDWSQSLSNVFIDAIGDVGARIAQGANIAKNLDTTNLSAGQAPVDNVSWGQTMVVGMNIIMLSIIFFSLLVLLVFAIIRVPILWALLIMSPIAWITYILPTTMNVNRQWWKYFLGWNVFMPIYLFFIYFGVLFLNNQDKVLANLASTQLGAFDYTFQFLFFYILIAIFLIGGAKFAMGASMAAGAGGVAGAIWARGRATARYAGVGFARRTPGIKQIEPMYKAAGQRMVQFQKETEKALQQRQSKWGGLFGVKGVSEQQFNKDVENAMQEMKDKKIYDKKDKLLEKINTGTSSEKVAAYKLLKEFHQEEGDAGQIKKVAQAFRDAGLTAQESKFMAGLNYEKMSAEDLTALTTDEFFNSATVPYRQQFLSKATDAQIKKGRYRDAEAYKKLISKYTEEDDILDALKKTDKDFLDGLSKNENLDLFESFKGMPDVQKFLAERMLKKGQFDPNQLLKIFADKDKGGLYDTDFERNRALKTAEEKRLMTVLRIRKELGIFDKKEDGTSRTYEEMLENRTSKLGAEDILKLTIDEKELADGKKEELLAALEKMLKRSPKRINSIVSNKEYTGEYQQLYGEMFDKVMADTASQRVAKLNIRKPGGRGGANPEFESTRPAPPQHLGGPTIIGGPPKQEPKKPSATPEIITDEKGTWRQVKERESFEPGREFRMDVSTGKNYVKLTDDEIKKLNQK